MYGSTWIGELWINIDYRLWSLANPRFCMVFFFPSVVNWIARKMCSSSTTFSSMEDNIWLVPVLCTHSFQSESSLRVNLPKWRETLPKNSWRMSIDRVPSFVVQQNMRESGFSSQSVDQRLTPTSTFLSGPQLYTISTFTLNMFGAGIKSSVWSFRASVYGLLKWGEDICFQVWARNFGRWSSH